MAQAQEALRKAKTVVAIGRSVGVTCNMRTRYCKIARNEMERPMGKRQLRNRARQTLAEERAMLEEVLNKAMQG